jgi:hypothetical protein
MVSGDMSGVGLTAHYTAYAWHLLGAPGAHRFVTWQGRLLHAAVSSVAAAAGVLGIGHPVSLLLEPRYRILEHELRSFGLNWFVELGAGLSYRGTAYCRDPEVSYVEVDLPGMISVKERLVGDAKGRGQRFLGGDVLDPELYLRLRDQVGDHERVAVISEGLSSYLPRTAFETLARRVSGFLRGCGGGVFLTDITPMDAVRRFGWFGSFFTWGIGVVARWPLGMPVESASDGVRLFEDAGFDRVSVHDPSSHPATADLDHDRIRDVVQVLEGRVDGQPPSGRSGKTT